jgi:hypothetical protein
VKPLRPRGDELVNGQPVRVYDSEGEVDRYTVVFMDTPACRENPKLLCCLGMNGSPFHPQGIGQHSGAMIGRHLGKRIRFADLPEDCQKLTLRDLTPTDENP